MKEEIPNTLRSVFGINGKQVVAIVGGMLASFSLLILGYMGYLFVSLSLELHRFDYDCGYLILDRNGAQLYHHPNKNNERSMYIAYHKLPEKVIKAFLAAEDSRFFRHHGFDASAMVRALVTNLKAGEIVSGASTITQQVVKMAYPRPRNLREKVKEIVRGVELEGIFSKEVILEKYLNRVYLGNNIRGVAAAAHYYFGKRLSSLGWVEAATLASLPKAPGYLNPYGKHRDALMARKEWVLHRLKSLNWISDSQWKEVVKSEVEFERPHFYFEAPHFVRLLIERFADEASKQKDMNTRFMNNQVAEWVTSLDLTYQHQIEQILAAHGDRLRYRGARQAAALIIRNDTAEVLAYVGSMQYSRKDRGFNDGVQALRSPGSTLKPFLYALALDMGYPTSMILHDTAKRYRTPQGEYSPVNYDRRCFGPVMFRQALGNSLNLSAVKLLNRIGYHTFYDTLKRLDLINFPQYGPEHYGLGLVVGNPEVKLFQLVRAFSCLANGGILKDIVFFKAGKKGYAERRRHERRIFSKAAAGIITDILSDPGARSITFGNSVFATLPFRVALKTGTSTHYRDCWTVGYTPEYTIGVWVGNFDGQSTFGLSGATGAGPIFTDIVKMLYRKRYPQSFSLPEDVETRKICGISGMAPGKFCQYITSELFVKGTDPLPQCTFHTQSDFRHHLPFEFASWILHRENKGLESTYTIDSSVNKGRVASMRAGGEESNHALSRSDTWRTTENIKNRGFNTLLSSNPLSSELQHRPRQSGNSTSFTVPHGVFYPLDVPEQTKNIHIQYPLNGDRFVIDTYSPNQTISISAMCKASTTKVTWFLNGIEIADTSPPFEFDWSMQRGNYELIAMTDQGESDMIHFSVQ